MEVASRPASRTASSRSQAKSAVGVRLPSITGVDNGGKPTANSLLHELDRRSCSSAGSNASRRPNSQNHRWRFLSSISDRLLLEALARKAKLRNSLPVIEYTVYPPEEFDDKRGLISTRRICRQKGLSAQCSRRTSIISEERETPAYSKTPDDASSFDFDSYDLDNDNDDDFYDDRPPSVVNDLSVKIYARACAMLHIIPCSYFSRNLLSPQLTVGRNVLGVLGAKACAIGLVTNTTVTSLDLTGNDIRDQGAKYMAEMLKENYYITELTLAENGITTSGLQAICEIMRENKIIRKLDLSGNGFEEYDAVHIATLIENNWFLRDLILHHNCFRERGGIVLANAITQNSTLETLDLSWNHLRRRGAVAIAEAMERNSSISVLKVAWNGFFVEGSEAMKEALAHNSTLVELDMSCNRLNKDCLEILLDGYKKNTSLVTLMLSNNPITADGALMLLRAIKEHSQSPLEYVDIASQSVDQRFISELQELEAERVVQVEHGVVFEHDEIEGEEDVFLDEDPLMVLMEFMRQKNMRLVDLFTSLDADGSKSLTYDEFRDGLLSVNIPLSSEALDRLLKKLDQDGDGEVDFSELMEGQRDHRRKLARISQKKDEPENEIQRISIKVKKLIELMEKQKKDERAAKEKAAMEAKVALEAKEKEAKERAIKEQASRKEKEKEKKKKQ